MKRHKWLSRRFFAATWSALVITYIVGTHQPEFLELTLFLAGIIALWVGGESYLKKVYKDKAE